MARFTLHAAGPQYEIRDAGKHFQTLKNHAGAKRLLALLNEAETLNVDAFLIAENPEFGREVAAHALARVFGMVARKPDPREPEAA